MNTSLNSFNSYTYFKSLKLCKRSQYIYINIFYLLNIYEMISLCKNLFYYTERGFKVGWKHKEIFVSNLLRSYVYTEAYHWIYAQPQQSESENF